MTITLNGTTGEIPASWTTATRPATPNTGQYGYNTTTGALDVYNGSSWTSIPMPTSQGTSGQLLQSVGAGATPTWAFSIYSASYLIVAGGGGSNNLYAVSNANNAASASYPQKVTKRAVPNLTFYDGAGTAGKISYYTTSWQNGGSVSSPSVSDSNFGLNTSIASSSAFCFDVTLSAEI